MANSSKNSLSNVFVSLISLDENKKLMTLLEMKPSDLSILEQVMASAAQQSFKERSRPFLGFDEKYIDGIKKVVNHLSSGKNYTCFNIVFEGRKENEALTFLLKKLKDHQIYKGEIFSEEESRLASKLLKAQKKLGMSFSSSTLIKEENRGMQAANLIGQSVKANHPKLERDLSKFPVLLLEAETAKKSSEFLKAFYKNFSPVISLSEKDLRFLIRTKEADTLNKIAKGLNKGLTFEKIRDLASLAKNEADIQNCIEQELDYQKDLKSYSKTEFFGSVNENLIHDILVKEIQGLCLSSVIEHSGQKDLRFWKEELTRSDLRKDLEQKAKETAPSIKKELSAFIQNEIENKEKNPQNSGKLLAYVYENSYWISALILDEKSKKELKSLIGTLIIKYKEIWPSQYSLKWTSVSSRAQEFYEEVLDTLLEHPNVHIVIQPKKEKENTGESLEKTIEEVYSYSANKKMEFRGQSNLLARIKKENLLKNTLAWYKSVETETSVWVQLLALLSESFYFFEHNKNTVLKTSKQGKVYIIQNILTLIQKKNEERLNRMGEESSYLKYDLQLDFTKLSEESLNFLSQPDLSAALTKRLAKAFAAGLSNETVYYLQSLNLDENSFQLRLRSLLLSYLYTSKKQRFYQKLLDEKTYSLDEIDFLMNEKWSLSKLEYLLELLEKGYPFWQMKRNFHTSLTLAKMQLLASEKKDFPTEKTSHGQVVFLMNSFFITDGEYERYQKEMIRSLKNKIIAADTDFKYGKTKNEIIQNEKRIEEKAQEIFSLLERSFCLSEFQNIVLKP